MPASELPPEHGGYQIRPAEPHDAKAFRMLLPHVGDASVRLVATSKNEQQVVGAAAVSRSLRSKPPLGPGIAVHVIPPWRRRGIGNALLEQLTTRVKASSAEAIYAMQKVEAGTEEEQGWRWLAFEPLETVVYHELPLNAIEARLAPLYDWMSKKEGIPESAAIIPLCDSDHQAVINLHLETLGGNRDLLLRKLRGEGLGAFHPLYSRVLMVEGEVKGCILAHRESKEVAVVDANILAPDVRGGWANLWLKLEATRGAVKLGIERFIYSTFDHYEDTRAFSKMLGGVETRRMLLMYRLLERSGDGYE